ncbi:hypothetical protein EUTSA_v10027039mg [Eutrema salsugineum]|uniref:Uncharacterized protein n=1 Tax=Eutrema salsugineum TaxID=72664 RepID=V4P455_EUTSA|nr:hypothetical protein EUTSA_v10027039mg [Eutrema salsugineum]
MKGFVDEETDDDYARFCDEVRAGKYPDSDDDNDDTGHDSDSQATHYQFKSVRRSYTDHLDMADPELCTSFITLEAMNPADNSPLTFRTCVKHDDDKDDVKDDVKESSFKVVVKKDCLMTFKCFSFFCLVEIKDGEEEEEETDHEWSEEVDERYKGEMPEWFSDDDDQQQRYVLQESELRDVVNNGWLHLFTEFAFYTKWRGLLDPKDIAECVELDPQEVVVETRGEEAETETRDKLKAPNAIFYISFQCADDPETDGLVNYRAVVRKAMDGKPGHMRLEVKCWSILNSAKQCGSEEESGSEESDDEEGDAEVCDAKECDAKECDSDGSDAEISEESFLPEFFLPEGSDTEESFLPEGSDAEESGSDMED